MSTHPHTCERQGAAPSSPADLSAFRSLFVRRLPPDQREGVEQFGRLLHQLARETPQERRDSSVHDCLLGVLEDLRLVEAFLSRLGVELELSDASPSDRTLCRYALREGRILRNLNRRLALRLEASRG